MSIASLKGHLEVVRLLLDRGAGVNIPAVVSESDSDGRDAVNASLTMHSRPLLALLLLLILIATWNF